MKKINLLLILSTLTFVFTANTQESKGVSSVKKQLLAKQLEYKNAIKNGKSINLNDYDILKEKSNQMNDSRDECYDFENEDECIAAGCMWDDEEGCYREDDENWEEDCDPDLACGTVLTCVDGLLYPTSCGPENCDDPIGACDDYEDDCFGLSYEDCEYLDFCEWMSNSPSDADGMCVEVEDENECFELSQDECMDSEFCEWSIVTTPDGVFEMCIDADGWNDDGGWDDGGNPEECGEGYLFDCSNDGDCCPESWIGDGYGDCEDQAWGCDLSCYDNDGGDCEESGDDGSWNSCDDLEYEECMMLDFCDWISDSDDPSASGFCVEVGEGDGGDDGDDCFDIYDCEGVPACDYLSWLGDGVCDDGTWGINFNCEEYGFDEGDCEETSDDGGWDDGGNPDECGDGYLFDCSDDGDCCPESWIGDGFPDCEDQAWGCDLSCYDNDGGDCEEGGDDGSWDECNDLDYEECVMLDYCQWIYDDSPTNNGYCTDAGSNDDGGNEDEFVALIIGDASVGMPGSEIEVPIYFESNTAIAGIQFTISDNPDWVIGVDMISNIDDCFEVNSNDVNGDLIGIIFSLEGCELAPSESASHFASIVYELSADAYFGSQIELYFEEAIVADVNGESLPVDTVGGTINISLAGDITSDGEINVLDVVSLINFILFVEEPNDYQFWAADINGDGDLNVLDVVLLVDLILD